MHFFVGFLIEIRMTLFAFQVSDLHKKGDYGQVVKILESTLPKRVTPTALAAAKKDKVERAEAGVVGHLDSTDTRRFHLDVMIDAQWKSENYK